MVITGGVLEGALLLFLFGSAARVYFQPFSREPLIESIIQTTVLPTSTSSTTPPPSAPPLPPFTPSYYSWINERFEIFPGHIFGLPDERVRMPLSEMLGRTHTSEVFAVNTDWAVKYTFSRFSDEESLLETRIMERVNSNAPEIAVMHKFSSDPIATPSKLIRYIVMERVGKPLQRIIPKAYNGKLPLNLAARITIRLVELVRRLHELGVVHGDLHFGNVAVRPNGGIILIDFGKSKFMDFERLRGMPPPNQVVCHATHSPWEARGHPVGFRDDIFHIIQMMGFLVHGNEYGSVLSAMCYGPHSTKQDVRNFLRFKTVENIFHTTLSVTFAAPDSVMQHRFSVGGILGVPHHASERIKTVFAELLKVVRQPPTPYAIPSYDLIIEYLRELESIPTEPVRLIENFDFIYKALGLD
jgi:serine/threonine protein kinase